jgi:hypothetical protein
MPFECAEKNALLHAWYKASRLYAKAVSEFREEVGSIFSDRSEFLRINALQAEIISLHLRDLYEKHLNKHGC